MTSRYEFVNVRHPDLSGIGRMSRNQLKRKAHLGFVEVTDEELAEEKKAAEAERRRHGKHEKEEPTPDFDLQAEDETPTAEPAGKSKKE